MRSCLTELLALTHHPAGSRVLDAIIDVATTPPRARRTSLRALETHFADVTIDDRVSARVGARFWAAADPYLKEKLARALLPHAARLAGSQIARTFTRRLVSLPVLPLLRLPPPRLLRRRRGGVRTTKEKGGHVVNRYNIVSDFQRSEGCWPESMPPS
ncbi:hypothetical protein V8E53_006918 [Lactarius tabidus]